MIAMQIEKHLNRPTNENLEIHNLPVFDFDFEQFGDMLYIYARRYTEPCYKIKHKFLNPNRKNVDTQFSNSDFRLSKYATDCFGYVWLVLLDLDKAGYIKIGTPNISHTALIIQNSVQKGYMQKFENLQQLKIKRAGIFFVLKNSEYGWTKSGSRHMGFWFYFGDNIHILHNIGRLGVCEAVFSSAEFEAYAASFFEFYV